MNSMRNRGMTIITLTAAERAQWNTAFDATRTRLTGVIADAAFIRSIRSN